MAKLEFEPRSYDSIARVLSPKPHYPMSLSNYLRQKWYSQSLGQKISLALSQISVLHPYSFRNFSQKCLYSLCLFQILWLCNKLPHNSVAEDQPLIMLMDSAVQEFEPGMAGTKWPLSMMSGPSARRLRDGIIGNPLYSHVCG